MKNIFSSIKQYWPYITGLGIAIIGIVIFMILQNKEPLPTADTNGEVNGNYSISNIMRLGEPYLCIFQKSDANSQIEGGVFIGTTTKDIYAEYDITMSTSTSAKQFSGFTLLKDGKAYTWTSLANIGSVSKESKSAVAGKSVAAQAQMIGRNDKMNYKCRPQKNGINESFFTIPNWITFSEIKN